MRRATAAGVGPRRDRKMQAPRVKKMWTAIGLIGAIVALTLMVRAIEPSFAFFPLAGETETPAQYGVRYDAIAVHTRDGEQLRAWWLHADRPTAAIVYFHGNGGNLSVWAPIVAGIAERGYSVFAVDYRGYGLSSGRPSEQGLYRDVDAVLEYVAPHRDAHVPLVYWGRSLGTAMAAYAATVARPDGLILESGFPDARSLVRSSPPLAFLALFSTYRFPTAELVNRAASPSLVVHGDRDSVIPFALGRALFERISGPKEFVIVHDGDHNDVRPRDSSRYWDAIDRFIVRVNSETALPRRTE
jgi:fermentation-respiration switch protein FrsA (DUF1100 family)